MAKTRDRRKTQKRVEEGRVNAADGHRSPASPSGAGRLLRIRVTNIATGHSKASVQIPVGLVDAGVKIGAQFAPDMEGVDMTKVLDAMRTGVIGKILDVMDDKNGEHVEISVE